MKNKYFAGMVISAAVAVWGAFSINSYFADKHHLNGASWVLAIVGVLGIGYFWMRLNQTTGGGKEER
jgi:hypothetical protein